MGLAIFAMLVLVFLGGFLAIGIVSYQHRNYRRARFVFIFMGLLFVVPGLLVSFFDADSILLNITLGPIILLALLSKYGLFSVSAELEMIFLFVILVSIPAVALVGLWLTRQKTLSE